MANVPYDNFYLSNEIEDQYNSRLDLQRFCTIDDTLEGTAGMLRKVHVYKATDGTQKLGIGEGNTRDISVHFSEREYRVQLAQNRFHYYDEEAMTDPMIVQVGTQHAGTDMFNTVNADAFAEFRKATLKVEADAFGFDAFADAVALLNVEGTDNDPEAVAPQTFAFVSPSDMAAVRKALGDSLKYVESFARTGYVGTVAGVSLYAKKDAEPGEIVVATKEAVTIFSKRGTEVEQQRDANERGNYVYSRKYYLAALTDETKAAKIVLKERGAGPMPRDKVALPTEGDDLLGKTVRDLIGADVAIGADGAVTGTIRKVAGYTGFSSAKAQQSGHYFPFYVSAPGKKVAVTTEGGTPKEADVEKNPDGRLWIILLDSEKKTKDTIEIKVDNSVLCKLTFTGATFEE